MGIKVIGAGMGRTGTLSLKVALEQLGYDKCFHMFELFQKPERVVHFENAAKGEKTDWESLFEGYQSAVDFPVAEYYKELSEQYPDAKVILTVRDPEAWYKSCSDTIFQAGVPSPVQLVRTLLLAIVSPITRKRLKIFKYNGGMMKRVVGKNTKDKKAVIEKYEQHNEKVKSTIPAERLLVYSVKDGWEPLCSFLGVPAPQTPFPKTNSTEDFWGHVVELRKGK